MARLFGTRPSLPHRPTTAQRRAATGALPRVPAALQDDVLAAFATTGGPQAFHPLLGGSDFRNAGASPALTRAGVRPFPGADRSARLTVATLQLAGWNRSDLATYAAVHHLHYSSSSLTQVPVDQPTVPLAADNADDSAVEVDLDQESLLATDPYAHQRAYFAPNTDAGFADGLSQVLDDVLANGSAYQGGDTHIAALSVSWGECEALTQADGTNQIGTVLEPILQSLVAAGVTVFSSAGDTGAYDCDDATTVAGRAVDYPASSPEVIGVGGTRLTSTTRTANTGSNWRESAWSCSGELDCTDNGGGGGGRSAYFSEPAYQSAHLSSTLDQAGRRMVPDIAADADPGTGFTVYTTDPHSAGHSFAVGGTSLASPVSAALLVDTLAAHAVDHGVGDVHEQLYAHASAATFRDVTSGTNGGYRAGTGYDLVTGLGEPLWPAIGDRLFTGARPTARAVLSRPSPHARSAWRQVRVTWGGTPPTGSTLLTAEVTVRTAAGTVVRETSAAAPAGSTTFTGRPGTTYRVSVVVGDAGHVLSLVKVASLRVPRHR